MPHILIVEDEPDLSALLDEYLVSAGYTTTAIMNGDEANTWLKKNQTDLILLDLMLPGMDGINICKEFRKFSNIPIIMLTAKVEEIDRLVGLELGADDYICKPYSPREVVARTKAVLRRSNSKHEDTHDSESTFSIDKDSLSVSLNKKQIKLTSIEISLLSLLHGQPGRIFSRQYIMDHIYSDYRVVSDRTVDSHIKKLRKKLHEVEPTLDLIHSIYGAGYRFEIQAKEPNEQ